MFGIGMPELMVIFVIALLVFGPKELPKIGKTIGKAMGEFRRASEELKEGIQREIEQAERENEGTSSPSPEPASATVSTESPTATPAPPEPQLELPMVAVPQATPPALETAGAPGQTTTADAGGPVASMTSEISEASRKPVATEAAEVESATQTASVAATPPKPAAGAASSAQSAETKHV